MQGTTRVLLCGLISSPARLPFPLTRGLPMCANSSGALLSGTGRENTAGEGGDQGGRSKAKSTEPAPTKTSILPVARRRRLFLRRKGRRDECIDIYAYITISAAEVVRPARSIEHTYVPQSISMHRPYRVYSKASLIKAALLPRLE